MDLGFETQSGCVKVPRELRGHVSVVVVVGVGSVGDGGNSSSQVLGDSVCLALFFGDFAKDHAKEVGCIGGGSNETRLDGLSTLKDRHRQTRNMHIEPNQFGPV